MKKYLTFIFILLASTFLFATKANAETCYYQIKDEISLRYDTSNRKYTVDEAFGFGSVNFSEKIKNDAKKAITDDRTGLNVEALPNGVCPNYIVYRHDTSNIGAKARHAAYGFTNYNDAKKFTDDSNDYGDILKAKLVHKSNINEDTYNSNIVKNQTASNQKEYPNGYYCFYQNEQVSVKYNPNKNNFIITQRNVDIGDDINAPNEPLINRNEEEYDDISGLYVAPVTTACPNYIVYRRKEPTLWFPSDGIWGFDSNADAQKFKNASNVKKMNAWLMSYTKEDGSKRTESEYEEQAEENVTRIIEHTAQYGLSIHTDPNYKMTCQELFGDRNTEGSIANIVNRVLKYPRYIIPALVILLGTIDFFKAVVAGKEDSMKKAQTTFIKRVVIGVCVFLVPFFVNVIMGLADYVWENTESCKETIVGK